jgi:hypothetical protein
LNARPADSSARIHRLAGYLREEIQRYERYRDEAAPEARERLDASIRKWQPIMEGENLSHQDLMQLFERCVPRGVVGAYEANCMEAWVTLLNAHRRKFLPYSHSSYFEALSHTWPLLDDCLGSYRGNPEAGETELLWWNTGCLVVYNDTEVFSPGCAARKWLGEASLQVRPLRQRSVECRLAGAGAAEPRPKSLTTR